MRSLLAVFLSLWPLAAVSAAAAETPVAPDSAEAGSAEAIAAATGDPRFLSP